MQALATEAHENRPAAAEAPRHLRVLQVGKFYPPHKGGMESHLHALCGQLRGRVDVEVLVSSDTRKTTEEVLDAVKVTRAGTLFDFAAAPVCPEAVRRMRDSRADIIHIHLPHPTALLAYLASGHAGRLVITYHSDIVRQRFMAKLFWPVLRTSLGRADAIVVASPNYVESSAVLQKFKTKCRVIPFGVPLEEFDRFDPAEVARIRERFGPRIVLGVGRLIYYKGFEHLVRAMKSVDAHLLVVGEGPLRGALELEAERTGVRDRVTLLGRVEDVVPYYHAADVFALSSVARSEAFGIVQLEAMACGKPVVNTALDSGVTFVSVDGMTGLTVAPGDSESLAAALNKLLADPALGARYGRAGRLRVEREFDLGVMGRRTLRLYEEVMSRPSRTPHAVPAAPGR
jgi:glycosyltransferase involved in cell wall biosynthesis